MRRLLPLKVVCFSQFPNQAGCAIPGKAKRKPGHTLGGVGERNSKSGQEAEDWIVWVLLVGSVCGLDPSLSSMQAQGKDTDTVPSANIKLQRESSSV